MGSDRYHPAQTRPACAHEWLCQITLSIWSTRVSNLAHRNAVRHVWALLLARIDEVVPLVFPKCGGDLLIVAFMNEGPVIRGCLGHLGKPTSALSLAPPRGPPLWALSVTDPQQAEWEADPQPQPAPDYELDQHVVW